TAGVLLTAPTDGVITAWHVHANADPGGSLALRVLRRDPDGVSFKGVATSGVVTAFYGDGIPAHAVSIPVRAGDYIGVDMIVGATSFPSPEVHVASTLPSGATLGVWGGGLAD